MSRVKPERSRVCAGGRRGGGGAIEDHDVRAGPAGRWRRSIRTDISGDWVPVINEDQPHRGPGPELGDYTGLPLNDADRQKAHVVGRDASSRSPSVKRRRIRRSTGCAAPSRRCGF